MKPFKIRWAEFSRLAASFQQDLLTRRRRALLLNWVRYSIGLSVVLYVVTYWVYACSIKSCTHPADWLFSLDDNELAAWAQAIGSVAAIVATWHLASRTERIAKKRVDAHEALQTLRYFSQMRSRIAAIRLMAAEDFNLFVTAELQPGARVVDKALAHGGHIATNVEAILPPIDIKYEISELVVSLNNSARRYEACFKRANPKRSMHGPSMGCFIFSEEGYNDCREELREVACLAADLEGELMAFEIAHEVQKRSRYKRG